MARQGGVHTELHRLNDGLRALGVRLQETADDADDRQARVATTLEVMAYQLSAINEEKLPAVIARLDQQNGHLEKLAERSAEHESRLRLVEVFCDERVKPVIQQVGENRLEIAKRAALYGLVGTLGVALATGVVQLLIAVL